MAIRNGLLLGLPDGIMVWIVHIINEIGYLGELITIFVINLLMDCICSLVLNDTYTYIFTEREALTSIWRLSSN